MCREPSRRNARHLPVMVYFHGGGFVLNGLETHDGLMRLIAAEAGIAVCAVSYSLAPEHRFPTQLHGGARGDRMAAGKNADEMGVDAGRIAVGGNSAGANLALSATWRCVTGGEARSPWPYCPTACSPPISTRRHITASAVASTA